MVVESSSAPIESESGVSSFRLRCDSWLIAGIPGWSRFSIFLVIYFADVSSLGSRIRTEIKSYR